VPLQSKLFTVPPNPRLNACLDSDAGHITSGSSGDHVKLIQIALSQLVPTFLSIDGIYGPATAAAVKQYKNAPQRQIRQSYQTTADDIVGIRTIQSLDTEMGVLENQSPATSGLVSGDVLGADHDHSQCPSPSVDGEIERAPDGTMSHVGTPMNPLAFGRMINIGGIFETKYLGFEDFMPDPALDKAVDPVFVKNRPLTSSIPKHRVSDICFRSTPLDDFMKKEIKRICIAGARLTFVGTNTTPTSPSTAEDPALLDYFRKLGVIIESGFVPPAVPDGIETRPFVVVTILNVNPDSQDPF
jgi:peptidoglycan hydrolase-like protein with peptidoglycan-binding domain